MTKQEKAEFKELRDKLDALLAKKDTDCPSCGKCKECGRADNPIPVPVNPWIWYYPQYPTYPRPIWTIENDQTISTTDIKYHTSGVTDMLNVSLDLLGEGQ